MQEREREKRERERRERRERERERDGGGVEGIHFRSKKEIYKLWVELSRSFGKTSYEVTERDVCG